MVVAAEDTREILAVMEAKEISAIKIHSPSTIGRAEAAVAT